MKMRILNGKLVDAPHALSAWERRGESGGRKKEGKSGREGKGGQKSKPTFSAGIGNGWRKEAEGRRPERKGTGKKRRPSAVRLSACPRPTFRPSRPSVRPSALRPLFSLLIKLLCSSSLPALLPPLPGFFRDEWLQSK